MRGGTRGKPAPDLPYVEYDDALDHPNLAGGVILRFSCDRRFTQKCVGFPKGPRGSLATRLEDCPVKVGKTTALMSPKRLVP